MRSLCLHQQLLSHQFSALFCFTDANVCIRRPRNETQQSTIFLVHSTDKSYIFLNTLILRNKVCWRQSVSHRCNPDDRHCNCTAVHHVLVRLSCHGHQGTTTFTKMCFVTQALRRKTAQFVYYTEQFQHQVMFSWRKGIRSRHARTTKNVCAFVLTRERKADF